MKTRGFFISGYSRQENCLVVDTVKELKAHQLNEDGYSLFLRTSGLNEKENFFELYQLNPKFDDCGLAMSAPIFQLHVDDTKGLPVKLLIFSNKMEMVYSNNTQSRIDLESITIEFHKN